MSQDQIINLLEKLRRDQLSEAETEELRQLVDQGSEEELLEAIQQMLESHAATPVPGDPHLDFDTLRAVLTVDRPERANGSGLYAYPGGLYADAEMASLDSIEGLSAQGPDYGADESAGPVYTAPGEDRPERSGEEDLTTEFAAESTGNGERPRRSWLRYAAAVILLVGSAAYYYFQSNRTTSTTIVVEQRNAEPAPIAPGKQGAILTLADGSTIVLDSLGNGLIAQQEGTQILLRDGELLYDAAQTATEITYNTMYTPNGRQFNLVLPDGSRVWLNAASSLRFPTVFAGSSREVEMTGEAYFEVAHNPDSPFRVKLDDGTVIEVKGTSFNVNAYADERARVKATLLDGAVEVQAAGVVRTLQPGQQAQVTAANRLEVHADVNLEQVMAWKNGLFYFEDADLKEVMQQLGRWYDMQIVYEGKIPERRYEGKMQRSLELADVLDLLSKNDIRFRVEGRDIIVYAQKD